jgi:polysaccharide pyruvyl transferase WcaK-like protein
VGLSNVQEGKLIQMKISFFGHFGQDNFGNDSTFKAILHHLRRRLPNAEVACICTGTERVAAEYHIATVPISAIVVKPWTLRNPLARLLRQVFIGIPSELYRWFAALVTLRDTDALIIPGTGLLTDAFGLFSWGPYNLFKWSVIAKLCRCKLLFVSVGAGPLYGVFGRYLVKSALRLADFRSYRETSTVRYLNSIGFSADDDPLYPDLAFSLPQAMIPPEGATTRPRRMVIGVGLMESFAIYGLKGPTDVTYDAYLENLIIFVKWLLDHEYDVRLLIGDITDRRVAGEFRSMLTERLSLPDQEHIIDEPAISVEQLLSQLAGTDMVVATRFHNILLSLLLNKPVISISFHHKCASLMNRMGLSEYCQNIEQLNAEQLIEQFCRLKDNADGLRDTIREKVEGCREALEEQYGLIFEDMLRGAVSKQRQDGLVNSTARHECD